MSSSPLFALMDCNNFYATCERIFQPKLAKTPIVVLSNNDGCIIARSNEAKDLGIEMGAPFFKFRDLILHKKVAVFSSNYALYGDMSNRVMKSLQMLVADLEIYSIDEAFFRLDNLMIENKIKLCEDIRYKINKWLGIPTSIGIAPTKTLAKIANRIAKKNLYNLAKNHVCDLTDVNLQNAVLQKTAVQDIWGIAKNTTAKLNAIGIYNGFDLKTANPKLIRQILGVVGERIACELQGISCLGLEEIKNRKNILSSKSFGKNIYEKSELQEAIANYVIRACQKMRGQNSSANGLYVYIRTNPFASKDRQYCRGLATGFVLPTNNVSQILKSAMKLLDQIYVKGFAYKKAGVMLLDLQNSDHNFQQDLFTSSQNFENIKSEKIQQTIEQINKIFGKNQAGNDNIFYAIQGVKKSWAMKSDNRSWRYTTNINEIVEVS